jgi:hypothetical protein
MAAPGTPAFSSGRAESIAPGSGRHDGIRTSGDLGGCDDGVSETRQSDPRFVAQGLIYVHSALAFIGLAGAFAAILGSRVTEYRSISFGVAGIAMLLLVAGISLLVTFFLRHWRSMSKPTAPGHPRQALDLWDDQLDR